MALIQHMCKRMINDRHVQQKQNTVTVCYASVFLLQQMDLWKACEHTTFDEFCEKIIRNLFGNDCDRVVEYISVVLKLLKFVLILNLKMPVTNINVDFSARIVLIKDTNSFVCSSCPESCFAAVYRALLHSLKHRGRCANGYPTKDNDNNMVQCCPKTVTHEICVNLAIYGAVIVTRMEMVDDKIQLRLKCTFKQENPHNPKQPTNNPCNQEFDDIASYDYHVCSQDCQFWPKKQNERHTSQYLLIQTIINKLEDDANFGETVIYNFSSTAWIKQPDLLYSKARAKELRWQLELLNLLSDKTWANKTFMSDVLGFDLKLLRDEASEWKKDHSGCNKKITSRTIGNWIRDLLPPVETVECYASIITNAIQSFENMNYIWLNKITTT